MVTLVTGANRGLGLAVAKLLIKQGKQLIVTGRDENMLRKAFTEAEKKNILAFETLDTVKWPKQQLSDWVQEKLTAVNEVYHCASPFSRVAPSQASETEIADFEQCAKNDLTLMQSLLTHALKINGGNFIAAGAIVGMNEFKDKTIFAQYKRNLRENIEYLSSENTDDKISIKHLNIGTFRDNNSTEVTFFADTFNKILSTQAVANFMILVNQTHNVHNSFNINCISAHEINEYELTLAPNDLNIAEDNTYTEKLTI